MYYKLFLILYCKHMKFINYYLNLFDICLRHLYLEALTFYLYRKIYLLLNFSIMSIFFLYLLNYLELYNILYSLIKLINFRNHNKKSAKFSLNFQF